MPAGVNMTEFANLELTAGAREELGNQALEFVLKYFQDFREMTVHPQIDPTEFRRRLNVSVPVSGETGSQVIDDCAHLIAPLCRTSGHPRMFGYVQSSGTFIGAIADFIASVLNQNVTSWRSAPGPTEIEHIVINWIKEILGYDRNATGILLSGGSMANFAAICTALRAKSGVDINLEGLRALKKAPVIYASEAVHMSIPKAAEMLGLGRNAVHLVPVKGDFTLDVAALDSAIRQDISAGKMPICAIANAGDVNTGAFDPIAEIAEVCRNHNVWCHVDGAYGGFAALAPSIRPLFDSISKVDSITLDPHKWLFAPLDAGCLLVRDPSALHRAFSHDAEYIKVIGADQITGFAFWDYGPELSRRFRALKIWMTIRQHGTAALGAAIEENIRLAKRLGEMAERADDFELLVPPGLSIACFRYAPPDLRTDLASNDHAGRAKSEEKLNKLNSDIMVKVQRGGESYISNTMINGKFALRACIVNYRTIDKDLEVLLDTIRKKAIESV